ncbi:Protein of unknown function, partial [Gryllus bimaculatus]
MYKEFLGESLSSLRSKLDRIKREQRDAAASVSEHIHSRFDMAGYTKRLHLQWRTPSSKSQVGVRHGDLATEDNAWKDAAEMTVVQAIPNAAVTAVDIPAKIRSRISPEVGTY